jgi:hypothetical protein
MIAAMKIALISAAVAAFLALDGYVLWATVGGGKGRRRRGGALLARAFQALGAVLILAALAAIAARVSGVISDHWLAVHWSCTDGTDFQRRDCNPGEAARAVWALAGGALLLGGLGLLAPAIRSARASAVS